MGVARIPPGILWVEPAFSKWGSAWMAMIISQCSIPRLEASLINEGDARTWAHGSTHSPDTRSGLVSA